MSASQPCAYHRPSWRSGNEICADILSKTRDRWAARRDTDEMPSVELRPYPTYKESGVDWIGEVPINWDVSALRHRYSQCLGKMLDSKRNTGNNQLPYLRNTDVQWDRINADDLPTMEITRHEYDRYTVQTGDLLVCEGGEVGRCALWSGNLTKCGFQKALHRLRPLNDKT